VVFPTNHLAGNSKRNLTVT